MLRVAVATSGGRDSTALLHCTVRQMAALGGETIALHVHHGLQPAADDWVRRVERQARRWGAAFDHRRLIGAPPAGASIEAWARKGRYQALAEMAQAAQCDLVLLAQHRRDQAETWMLQALRGGGPAGLSAMPAAVERHGITWARPWLHMPREAIEAYVRRHRISYVDDPSNGDPRYARNRLRLQVWPALTRAFPDAESALVAATLHAQQAAALADEILQEDLPGLLDGPALVVERWQQLPAARRRNALRGWLAQHLPQVVPHALLQRLQRELPVSVAAQWPAGDAWTLRLYRGRLLAVSVSVSGEDTVSNSDESVHLGPIDTTGEHVVPGWPGRLCVMAASAQGLPRAAMLQLTARARVGSEQFALAPKGQPRSLKKQFQARGIPAWQRTGPLLFDPQGRLVFVPGLGVDARVWAQPGEPQFSLQWQPQGQGRADSSGQPKPAR